MVSGPRGNDRREQGSAQEKQEEMMALKRSIIQSHSCSACALRLFRSEYSIHTTGAVWRISG